MRRGQVWKSLPTAISGYAKRKTRIYEMNRIAANFYYTNLFKGKDKAGLQYFANRKLTPQTIKKYGLGYASDSWNELTDVLRSKGYSDEEMAGRNEERTHLRYVPKARYVPYR